MEIAHVPNVRPQLICRALVAITVSVALPALGVIAPGAARAASTGGNASISLSKTVGSTTVKPVLGLTLAADRTDAIPGDAITYSATVTNTGTQLGAIGTYKAANNGNVTATVAGYWDDIEYFSSAKAKWLALGGFAARQSGYTFVVPPPITSGMTLTATSVPASGVTYPTSGDPILGTRISTSATASWSYKAVVSLTPSQVATLSKATGIRNVVHVEVTPRSLSVGQPFTYRAEFTNPLLRTSAAATNVSVTITPPTGSAVVFNQTTTPGLASLAPGASVTVSAKYTVPPVAPKGASETDSAYLSRLASIDGSKLTANASAQGSGSNGAVSAAASPVNVTEHLAITTITKSGPSTATAGSTAAYSLALCNTGSAPAQAFSINDTLPDGTTGTVTGVPASLAPGQCTTADSSIAIPPTQAVGNLTDTATLSWQDANANSYGIISATFTTRVTVSLASASLTLAPNAALNPVGGHQTLIATLVGSDGSPITGEKVSFSVTGANAGTSSGTTDSSGQATFSYTGANAGIDTAQATVDDGGVHLESNTSLITWGKFVNPVSTTTVHGNFFAEDPSATTFVAKPGDTPAFSQDFPTIDFDPPPGTVNGTPTGIDNSTRPFTDVTTDLSGNFSGTSVAQGNGLQAGVGSMQAFDAEFTGDIIVTQASDVTFHIRADDGFILGFGGGASRVSGTYENFPQPGTSPFQGYPVVGAFDQPPPCSPCSTTPTYTEVVHFPQPGSYPYEIDYFECCDSNLSLTMTVATVTPTSSALSVYTGYADGLRAAGSVFPFPWEGSPGADFVGCAHWSGGPVNDPCSYDAGAIRIDNNTTKPITVDDVAVDIGGNHFDLWGSNTIPGGQSLILSETTQFNFDTSDYSSSSCNQNNGVIPQISVTTGGISTTYQDTHQVLNTGGFDAVCNGNESTAWTLIGGQPSTIDTPLPPAVTLALSAAATNRLNVGQAQTFTVAAMDGGGQPVAGLSVTPSVFGANTTQLPAVQTDANGLATFSYTGLAAGTDTISATALIGGLRVASNTASVQWSIPGGGGPGQAPPAIADVSPADGALVTKPVPVRATFTPPSGQTISSWKVTYQAMDPGPEITLAQGTGTPPDPIATFDPTLLANDTYAIHFYATASGGGTQEETTTVAVYGNLKLGRYVTTYQDMNVPVQGYQMQVLRTYDSTDKSVGDFGVGWHVSVSNFRTTSNRQLGAGGWTEYPTSCFIICSYGYKTSVAHYVTVTFPDGHQEVFDFTPTGPSLTLVDFARATTAFTQRAGTLANGNTLQDARGPVVLSNGFDGNLYDGNSVYDPTRFQLTLHNGTVLILDVHMGLVSETDPNGNSLTVDQNGIHSSSGQSITFTRDSQGRITQITGPGGQALSYSYDAAGNLASSADADGNTTTYTYDGNHNLLQATGPGGQALQTLQYNSDGRLVAVTNGDGQTTQISSDVPGQQQTVTDPSGKLTAVYTYDDQGDLVRVDLAFGGQTLTWTYQYDSSGRPVKVVDPLGRTTTATYDAAGDPLTITDAAGGTTTLTYNSLGEPTSITDANGTVVLTATYNSAGNLTSALRADGSSMSGTYDSAGNLTKVVDSAGNTTTFAYDSAGNVTQATDPSGHTSNATFDASGRLTSVTDAGGSTASFTYDQAGNLLTETDPAGNATTYTYDSLGRLASRTDPSGTTTSYTYDGANRLTGVTTPLGTTTYTYDADGNVIKAVSPTGDVTNYSYDPLGRLTEAANAVSDIQRTYDADGELLSESTQLNGTGAPPKTTLSYTYNALGERLTRTGPDGTTSYGYDNLGRLTSITDPAGGKFGISYDIASRPVQMTRPNGVTDTLTYNPLGQLAERMSALGSTVIADSRYAYDAVGRRVSMTDLTGTTQYAYDAVGRLASATPPGRAATTYTYDSRGNRLTPGSVLGSTNMYDNADRLLGDLNTAYSYDALGRLTKIVNNGTGTTTGFTWNGNSQLAGVANPDGTTTSYQYDALGRRVAITEAGQTTRYIYDGDNIAYEYDGTGSLAASYVFLPGADQPLEMVRGSQRSYYIQDGNSNVVALTDGSGNTTATYRYDPFGQLVASTGSVTNPFTFAGREYDARSGLYYDRARYYDPSTGRFISPDPLGALNPYPYAASSPVDNTDPSGALLAEYAPLLPQQISMGTSLANFTRCIGLAMLAGLNGAWSGRPVSPETIHELLHSAAEEYAGVTDITDLIYGSGEARGRAAASLLLDGGDAANETLTVSSVRVTATPVIVTEISHWHGSTGGIEGDVWLASSEPGYLITGSVTESEPFPGLGPVSSVWGDFSTGWDLKDWFVDTCNLRCGSYQYKG